MALPLKAVASQGPSHPQTIPCSRCHLIQCARPCRNAGEFFRITDHFNTNTNTTQHKTTPILGTNNAGSPDARAHARQNVAASEWDNDRMDHLRCLQAQLHALRGKGKSGGLPEKRHCIKAQINDIRTGVEADYGGRGTWRRNSPEDELRRIEARMRAPNTSTLLLDQLIQEKTRIQDGGEPHTFEYVQTGTVSRWLIHKGYGFIIAESGKTIFVPSRATPPEAGGRLKEGEKIEFIATQVPKGFQAVKVVLLMPRDGEAGRQADTQQLFKEASSPKVVEVLALANQIHDSSTTEHNQAGQKYQELSPYAIKRLGEAVKSKHAQDREFQREAKMLLAQIQNTAKSGNVQVVPLVAVRQARGRLKVMANKLFIVVAVDTWRIITVWVR